MAIAAAANVFEQVRGHGGGWIKLLHSPTPRAAETFAIMHEELQRLSLSSNVYLFKNTRVSTRIEAGGVIGPLMKRGIPYEETVEHWLAHPDSIPGRTPMDIAGRIGKLIDIIARLAKRIALGPPIYYIAVTHEIPQAGFLYKITGKRLSQMGGGIRNCESLVIKFSTGQITLEFRDQSIELCDFSF